jgi:transposase
MTPERYLVHLNPRNPSIGGFTYPDLDRALLALIRIRRRWPRATLLVIPAQQGGGIIRKK